MMKKAEIIPDQLDAIDALRALAAIGHRAWRWCMTNMAISMAS